MNNAGTPGTYKPFAEQRLDDWQRTVDINLTGTFLCLQAELAVMAEAGRGAIVNVASAAGLMGFANLPAYVASKHGVVGLTKSVALEFARGGGIRVNAVCPGNVHTPMLEGFAGGDQEALQGMGKVTPIGRLARAGRDRRGHRVAVLGRGQLRDRPRHGRRRRRPGHLNRPPSTGGGRTGGGSGQKWVRGVTGWVACRAWGLRERSSRRAG